MNRILIVNGKEYEVIYTNKAKATLEGLENKSIMDIIGAVLSNPTNIKVDTCVNIVYAGIKFSDEGKSITRDELYDLLPAETIDLAKVTYEFFNIMIEDVGVKKAMKTKDENSGK